MVSVGPRRRLLYIGGYGRSGSTLLDMLLDAHPQLIGVGEVNRLFEQVLAGAACSCGVIITSCPFWSVVLARLQDTMPGMTPQAARSITDEVEFVLSGWYLRHDATSAAAKSYRELWQGVFEAVTHASGGRTIVDSSKNNYRTALRALALRRICGYDVRVAHVVRDPRGVMWSFFRGRNEVMRSGAKRAAALPAVRALAGWINANASVHASASVIDVTRVRYEDLCMDPTRALTTLLTHWEMDPAPVLEALKDGNALANGHGIAGNRLRAEGVLRIRLDEEWRLNLPGYARLLAWVTWPLSRRYGYRLSRSESTEDRHSAD